MTTNTHPRMTELSFSRTAKRIASFSEDEVEVSKAQRN